ncbi:hypothetical protein O3P69_001765 [Scylla paramamosain]|uniref:Uncharacterized protein n=1 Tax=Scylla paramamosain TaxID=85552 RepID=A0AAW0V0C2_SCYPA
MARVLMKKTCAADDEDEGYVRPQERVSLDLRIGLRVAIELQEAPSKERQRQEVSIQAKRACDQSPVGQSCRVHRDQQSHRRHAGHHADAALAFSVKRLLDINSTVLKGGKTAIWDFGSPAKTIIHTRTMVSFLGFAKNMLRLSMSILRGTGIDPNNKYLKKSTLSLERFYGKDSFVSIVNATKKSMEMTEPMPNDRLSADLVETCDIRRGEGNCDDRDRNNCSFDIARDVLDYFSASPMALVFTVITDVEDRERVMNIGNMALLAIWIKVRVLKLDWQSNAINISNNKFLSTDLCTQLLLTDLANFGVLGESKILNKLDCNINKMHKDGIQSPTEAEQFNFLKMMPLQDRKVAASLHGHVNARTRTHLGTRSAR